MAIWVGRLRTGTPRLISLFSTQSFSQVDEGTRFIETCMRIQRVSAELGVEEFAVFALVTAIAVVGTMLTKTVTPSRMFMLACLTIDHLFSIHTVRAFVRNIQGTDIRLRRGYGTRLLG